MPTINLKTYYDFTGAAVMPSAFTLQTLPTCAAGFSVKNVLWDTAANMIVTTTTPTTIGAVQILDDCTGAFSIVEGNKSAIEQYLSNECCVKLIASASFINEINAPNGSPTCTDGSFEYPIIADMTPYGGSATQVVTSDEDLITILNGLTGVDVLVNYCQWYFPADYTGTISDLEVLLFTPPTILPTNEDSTETEIEYTATTGDIDGTPCVVTDITWSQSIDGGTTSTTPISLGTALAGNIELCDFDISTLVGSANFTGTLTATFEITTSCGVGTQTLNVPITTDGNGLIKIVDSNACFLLKSVPTITTLGTDFWGDYNVDKTTGVTQVQIENTLEAPVGSAPQNVPAGECATIVIETYNPVTMVTTTYETLSGTVGGAASTWTSTLPAAQSVLNHIPATDILSDSGVTTWQMDKKQWSIDNGFSGVNLGVEINIYSYAGGTCAANPSANYPIQSANTDNEVTVKQVYAYDGFQSNQGNRDFASSANGLQYQFPTELSQTVYSGETFWSDIKTYEASVNGSSWQDILPIHPPVNGGAITNGASPDLNALQRAILSPSRDFTIAYVDSLFDAVGDKEIEVRWTYDTNPSTNVELNGYQRIRNDQNSVAQPYDISAFFVEVRFRYGAGSNLFNPTTGSVQYGHYNKTGRENTNSNPQVYYQLSADGGLPYTSGVQVPVTPVVPIPSSIVELLTPITLQLNQQGIYQLYSFYRPNDTQPLRISEALYEGVLYTW